jgi:glycosyl-4,4'-diaponeurosporenoate acyltransferase
VRRGEVAHWWSVLAAPVLAFAWPAAVVVPMLVVALAVNVPCIVALRFNRSRIACLLAAPQRRRAERDADR